MSPRRIESVLGRNSNTLVCFFGDRVVLEKCDYSFARVSFQQEERFKYGPIWNYLNVLTFM